MQFNHEADRRDKTSGLIAARVSFRMLDPVFAIMRRAAIASAMALAIPLGAIADEHRSEAFEFALIGDYPYFPRDYAGMPHLLEDLRNEGSLSFVIHLGDLHNPRFTECSPSLFRERREWFVGLGVPFVLTPGDNDWADCRDDPLGNLTSVREVFFANPTRADGDNGFALRSQSQAGQFPEVVENAIWQRGGVVFATLHMIAPGIIPWPDETSQTRAELIAAGEVWLEEAFRVARDANARAVFLATQVSLWSVSGSPVMLDLMNPDLIGVSSVFVGFEEKLIRNVREFGRPVVLANGDSHYFRVDKPLVDQDLETLQTFTRVEGFGSPHGQWVRVRVDPDRPEVFVFQQELVSKNLYTLVPREERNDGFEDDDHAGLKIVVRIIQAIPKLLSIVGALVLAWWSVKAIRRYLAGRSARGG